MKQNLIIIVTLFLAYPVNCFSQQDYYSTDGINRLTPSEIEEIREQKENFYSGKSKKPLFASIVVQYSEQIKNETVHHVVINLSYNKPKSKIVKGPLADLVGKKLPDTVLKDLAGSDFKLDNIIGKPTLITTWFINCPPCIKEIPLLNYLSKTLGNEYNFIALTFEERNKIKDFLTEKEFNVYHLTDAKEYLNQLNLNSYPTNLFLDEDGILRFISGEIVFTKEPNEPYKIVEDKIREFFTPKN